MHHLAAHMVHFATQNTDDNQSTEDADYPLDDAQVALDFAEEWKETGRRARGRHRGGRGGNKNRAFVAGGRCVQGEDSGRHPPSATEGPFYPDLSKLDPQDQFWMNKGISIGQATWCQQQHRCY